MHDAIGITSRSMPRVPQRDGWQQNQQQNDQWTPKQRELEPMHADTFYDRLQSSQAAIFTGCFNITDNLEYRPKNRLTERILAFPPNRCTDSTDSPEIDRHLRKSGLHHPLQQFMSAIFLLKIVAFNTPDIHRKKRCFSKYKVAELNSKNPDQWRLSPSNLRIL